MKTTAPIKVCVAGATGWTGSLVCKAILASKDFKLTGAIARKEAGQTLGDVKIVTRLEDVAAPFDVLVDYTKPDSVKARALTALARGSRVVIGTSGLAAADFADLDAVARERGLGVVAAGNFSLTAALAKHFALIAAKHLPSWEIIDYASAGKVDAPSGTTRELAEELAHVKQNHIALPVDQTIGYKEARGTNLGGAQVHSVRLPGYVIAFETHFGLPHERLTIRHDAGSGADPYVGGTLLAVKKVMEVTGVVRGLDKLLF